MRNKLRQMFLTCVLLVYFVAMAYVDPSSSQSQPIIAVNPLKSTISVGESFTVDINIADVTLENTYSSGVTGWEVAISFNSTVPPVLEVLSVGRGPWLRTAETATEKANWVTPKINNTGGAIVAAEAFVPAKKPGALGSGTLCNITFRAVSVGSTSLHFYKTLLRAWDGVTLKAIDHTSADGVFTNVHDVSINSVSPSSLDVQAGASVSVDVVAANQGDFSETFSITVYRSIGLLRLSPAIGTQSVTGLASDESRTLSFFWDTSGSYAGNYTLAAEASVVAGEVDTADNKLVDGEVQVSVLGAPIASFVVSSHLPSVGETVRFNSTSVDSDGGSIAQWQWDFNADGVVDATAKDATHTYAATGTYMPILYVTDNDGKKSFTYETVKATTFPLASFTYSPLEVLVRQPVTFNSTSFDADGYIASWKWDFDSDGSVDSSDENATFTYNEARTFKVNLTVTDNDGLTDSETMDLVASKKHDVTVSTVCQTYGVDYGIWAAEAPQTQHNVITSTYAGFQSLNVTITLENIGTEIETFHVRAYYNDTLIGSTQVVNLAPRDEAPSNLIRVGIVPWNTLAIPGGNCTIKVVADLESDQDMDNNEIAWGFGVNRADIGIKGVTVSADRLLAGSLLNVSVVVTNKGTQLIDTCGLHVSFENATNYLTLLEQSFTVGQIAIGKEKSCSVNLNLTKANISPGIYLLSVEASKLIAEYYTLNNEFIYGNVTVGASLISVHADVLKASVGSTVSINGSIIPNRSNLGVIVRYRDIESGASMWKILKRPTTNVNGTFSCSWSPDKTGTFELQAIWDGNNDALGSQSEILNIVVEPATTNIFLIVGAGAAIVVVLIVVVYFLKFRKPKKFMKVTS